MLNLIHHRFSTLIRKKSEMLFIISHLIQNFFPTFHSTELNSLQQIELHTIMPKGLYRKTLNLLQKSMNPNIHTRLKVCEE